ncbi:hypothetical protein BASA81_004821 [Batrachochytrium salamandrivorans]|nr:hypothetical protein BASA81_004821 [Batrachochytrium salamandrivorans]
MAQALVSSLVFDEQEIVSAKTLAYELDVSAQEAARVLEEFYLANDSLLDSTWLQVTSSAVVLGAEQSPGAKLFTVQKKSTLDAQQLGLSLEASRRKLIREDKQERLLHNRFGLVTCSEAKVTGEQVVFKPQAPVAPSLPVSKPAPTAATTTAANFFTIKRAEDKPKPEQPPPQALMAQDKPKLVEQDKPKLVEQDKPKPKPVEKPLPPPRKKPVTVVLSSSSSSDSEGEEDSAPSAAEEEEDEMDGPLVTAAAVVTTAKPTATAKKKTKKKESAAAVQAKKKSKVVMSDDEDEDAKRKLKKEASKAKREENKELARAEKKRQEIELANEAKADFLRNQLGVATSAPTITVKKMKRMLKTRTFVDDEGFEVTEDVFEEVEVEEQEEPVAAVSISRSSSLPKSTTNASGSKPKPSSAAPTRQASLSSFFTKKQKE